jgi:hypothetical protein
MRRSKRCPLAGLPDWKMTSLLTIAFWDQDEFLAHSHREIEMKRLTKSIFWVDGSYSRAWYQLAVVASKEGRFENALFCIDCGVELEPDHPELWNEKGYLLGRLKRHQEAFDCYVRAASFGTGHRRHRSPGRCAARASSLSTLTAWTKRKTRYDGRWSWSRTARPPTMNSATSRTCGKAGGGKGRDPLVSPLVRESSDRSSDDPPVGVGRGSAIDTRTEDRWGRKTTPESSMHS